RLLEVDVEMALRGGEARARGQPDEVERERHAACLVEIGDAPDEPSVRVPPRAVVRYVKVADRPRSTALRQRGQHLRRQLGPSIKGRAKEAERVRGHHLVLVIELVLAQMDVTPQPTLEAASRFDDVGTRGHESYCRVGRLKLVERFSWGRAFPRCRLPVVLPLF